jgi:hypothetical protein
MLSPLHKHNMDQLISQMKPAAAKKEEVEASRKRGTGGSYKQFFFSRLQ